MMRDPEKYTWADPYRDEARLSPGACLLIVVGGCLMFWLVAVLAIKWAFGH